MEKFRPEDPECHGSANGKLQQSVREAFDDVFGEKKRRAAIFRSDGLRCSMTRTVVQPLFQSLVNFGPSGRQLRPCFGFFLLLLSPQTVPDDIPPASGRLIGSMTSGVTFPPHTLSTNGEIQFQLPAMFQCLLFN